MVGTVHHYVAAHALAAIGLNREEFPVAGTIDRCVQSRIAWSRCNAGAIFEAGTMVLVAFLAQEGWTCLQQSGGVGPVGDVAV